MNHFNTSIKNAASMAAFLDYLLSFVLSHFWFAIPQLVLQADWQDVWHSPQPPFLALSHKLRVSIVLMCFIIFTFYNEILLQPIIS